MIHEQRKKIRNNRAFTLVELIVVIAVLGILILLAAPKFLGYTNDAKIAQIKADIKTYETALAAELVDDDKFSKDWTEVDGSTLEKHKDDEKLFSKKGFVDSTYKFDGDYVEIPNDLGLIKTDLKGDFFLGEGGEVYYYDEKVKIDKGSNGGATENPGKEITDGEQEVLPVANFKLARLIAHEDSSYAISAEDGNLYVKGGNYQGVAGVGHANAINEWTRVALPQGVKVKEVVIIGYYLTYFVTTDNDLYATGNSKALGLGSSGVTTTPTKISTLKVKEISSAHVLFENGDLYLLGASVGNESGIGCRSCSGSYMLVTTNIDDIIYSEGGVYYYNFMKSKDGSLLGSGYWYDPNNSSANNAKYLHFHNAWTAENDSKFGKIYDYKTFSLNDVKSVDMAGPTVNFLLKNGDVISDKFGESVEYFPSITFDKTQQDGVKTLTNIKQMELVGANYEGSVFAVSNDGKVYGYGKNVGGILGLGHSNKVLEWTLLPELSNKNISEIVSARGSSIVFKTKDNKFYGLGVNSSIGLNSKTPVELELKFN